jgi:hypothetical protein
MPGYAQTSLYDKSSPSVGRTETSGMHDINACYLRLNHFDNMNNFGPCSTFAAATRQAIDLGVQPTDDGTNDE